MRLRPTRQHATAAKRGVPSRRRRGKAKDRDSRRGAEAQRKIWETHLSNQFSPVSEGYCVVSIWPVFGGCGFNSRKDAKTQRKGQRQGLPQRRRGAEILNTGRVGLSDRTRSRPSHPTLHRSITRLAVPPYRSPNPTALQLTYLPAFPLRLRASAGEPAFPLRLCVFARGIAFFGRCRGSITITITITITRTSTRSDAFLIFPCTVRLPDSEFRIKKTISRQDAKTQRKRGIAADAGPKLLTPDSRPLPPPCPIHGPGVLNSCG